MFNSLNKKGGVMKTNSQRQKRQNQINRQIAYNNYIRAATIKKQKLMQQQQRSKQKRWRNQENSLLEKASYFKYPKKLHLYWDKSPLSFLNLLTIKSFNRYHKNWQIFVYTPKNKCNHMSWTSHEQKKKYTGKCYFNELYKIDNVEIVSIDLNEIGFYSDASEVIKSDYFRYYILYEKGGVWSDFDIVYTSSIENKLNFISDCIIFAHFDEKYQCYYYPIGLFLSVPQSPFFKLILNSCKKFYDKTNYQSIGANMFAKILGNNLINCEKKLKDLNCNVSVCTRQNIYLPLQWYEINKVYDNMTYNLSNENVGIHWFNGATVSKNYINNLDTRLEDFKVTCYLDSLIKKYIIKEKISIVMAYFNRKEQLEMTLESIKKSKYPNKEIIIVDDNSRQDQRVELFIDNYRNDLDIKVITIEEKEKTWVNPCIPFNIGIKEASGEIIVLQNPEVIHVGDCLTFVNDNLEEKDWISFNCYGSPNFQFNKQIEKKNRK